MPITGSILRRPVSAFSREFRQGISPVPVRLRERHILRRLFAEICVDSSLPSSTVSYGSTHRRTFRSNLQMPRSAGPTPRTITASHTRKTTIGTMSATRRIRRSRNPRPGAPFRKATTSAIKVIRTTISSSMSGINCGLLTNQGQLQSLPYFTSKTSLKNSLDSSLTRLS